jgi:hypothetical protein
MCTKIEVMKVKAVTDPMSERPVSPAPRPVVDDWDALLAPYVAPATAHRPDSTGHSRGRRVGVAAGLLPQLFLLGCLIYGLVRAHTDADRSDLMQLVFANMYVVPAAAVVGGLCLIAPASRPFGRALLYSTGFSALAFTMVCCATTAY